MFWVRISSKMSNFTMAMSNFTKSNTCLASSHYLNSNICIYTVFERYITYISYGWEIVTMFFVLSTFSSSIYYFLIKNNHRLTKRWATATPRLYTIGKVLLAWKIITSVRPNLQWAVQRQNSSKEKTTVPHTSLMSDVRKFNNGREKCWKYGSWTAFLQPHFKNLFFLLEFSYSLLTVSHPEFNFRGGF